MKIKQIMERMIEMMFFIFNLLSSVDPQIQQLLNNLMEVLLLILYAIGSCGLAFSTVLSNMLLKFIVTLKTKENI